MDRLPRDRFAEQRLYRRPGAMVRRLPRAKRYRQADGKLSGQVAQKLGKQQKL
jgi:hypothetical protein